MPSQDERKKRPTEIMEAGFLRASGREIWRPGYGAGALETDKLMRGRSLQGIRKSRRAPRDEVAKCTMLLITCLILTWRRVSVRSNSSFMLKLIGGNH